MKIQTNYYHNVSEAEDLDYVTSKTATNQFVSLGEMVKRVSRGEQLDLADHTNDNPLDYKDKFDVLDLYMSENPKHEAAEKAARDEKEANEKEIERQRIIDEYEKSKKTTSE